jgi:hypothetical protein
MELGFNPLEQLFGLLWLSALGLNLLEDVRPAIAGIAEDAELSEGATRWEGFEVCGDGVECGVFEHLNGLNSSVAQFDASALAAIVGNDGIGNLIITVMAISGESALEGGVILGEDLEMALNGGLKFRFLDGRGAIVEGGDGGVDGPKQMSIERILMGPGGNEMSEVLVTSASDGLAILGIDVPRGELSGLGQLLSEVCDRGDDALGGGEGGDFKL